MKVQLKGEYIKIAQKIKKKIKVNPFDYISDLSPKKHYVVLEICIYFNPSHGHDVVEYAISTDAGNWATVPIELFEIVDERPSKKWVLKYFSLGFALSLPEFNGFLIDEVTDYEPVAKNKFKEIVKIMENEFDD